MKNKLKKVVAVLSGALCALSFSVCIFADDFNDVPKTHFAYNAINSVASMGIMTADGSGNFNPDSYIDKFDTSKMFAKLMGYKYSDISDEEKSYYETAYQNKKSIISAYSSKYEKWNSSADYEIAYLLDKGFYKESDLEQFVILSSSGKEQLRALSREEMADFLVRYIGCGDKQPSMSTLFADDAAIASDKKQAVYYLKDIGVISGTTDGKFVPKGAVDRADFCYLLNLTMINTGKISDNQTVKNVNNVDSTSCTVEKYFSSLNIMQVNENGTQKLYKVSSSATIKINGALGQISDIPIGASADITVNNDEIILIEATISAAQTVTESTTQTTTEESGQSSEKSVVSDNNTIDSPAPADDNLTPISGTISEIGTNTITLNYKMIDALNNISTQNKAYEVSSDCKVTKDGIETTISSAEKDDMAQAYVYGSKIYKLDLTSLEKDEEDEEEERIDGYVCAMNIGKEVSMIGLSETMDSDYTIYTVDTDNVPLNILSIGDKVRAYALNGKVYALTVKKEFDNNSVVGYIDTKKSDYITVEYYDGEAIHTSKVTIESDTVITSGVSGKTIKTSDLDEDQRVYVILDDDGKTAKKITLIENI